eukprot:350015-Chlamydomonas_euryale.AAC.4
MAASRPTTRRAARRRCRVPRQTGTARRATRTSARSRKGGVQQLDLRCGLCVWGGGGAAGGTNLAGFQDIVPNSQVQGAASQGWLSLGGKVGGGEDNTIRG